MSSKFQAMQPASKGENNKRWALRQKFTFSGDRDRRIEVKEDDPVWSYLRDHIPDINLESIQLIQLRIGFYDHYRLFLCRFADSQYVSAFLLGDRHIAKRSRFLPLDGTSPPIHEANKRSRIRLNLDHSLDYVRFFGEFVWAGEKNPFLFISNISHVPDPAGPEANREWLRRVLGTRFQIDNNGNITSHPKQTRLFSGQKIFEHAWPVAYRDNNTGKYILFVSHMLVHSNGYIEMKQDLPVAELGECNVAPVMTSAIRRPYAPYTSIDRLRFFSYRMIGRTALFVYVASGLAVSTIYYASLFAPEKIVGVISFLSGGGA